ncbi:terminal uridylyltransferase Tailor-like [Drosophila serrata]|uniref:terminal uridylyltransferase Tailor-like n=1 Tax=Drosophila serrata TaxID=7274 RepID=UPI000A1CF5ED|nr:terminal uridylyltransferase Tailor-like [Drosophila serrata]
MVTQTCQKYSENFDYFERFIRQTYIYRFPNKMELDSVNFWENLKKKVDKADYIKTTGHDQIISDLKQALYSDFPGTPIYAFGSRIMGIATADSDLDLYVDADGNNIYTEYSTQTRLRNLMKIKKALSSSANWSFTKSFHGVYPLVTARHKDSNILCDISFSMKITVDQNNLVNYIFDLQPIARYMVIYLRSWALANGLSNFRGHIFTLMVIFFLQIRGQLPSVSNLQTNLLPNFGPWKTDFVKLGLSSFNMKPIPLNAIEVRNILKDFFRYYSEFEYGQLVVCPWLGKGVYRTMIKSYMPLGSLRFKGLFCDRAMIIQDIIHLNQNKAYAITQSELTNFKLICKQNK